VRKLKPKVVLFENVRGLLSMKLGKKLLIEEILKQLHELGYDCQFKLVDAYGCRGCPCCGWLSGGTPER
jgi:site-specific DNA-cytosine methylase